MCELRDQIPSQQLTRSKCPERSERTNGIMDLLSFEAGRLEFFKSEKSSERPEV